MKDVLDGTSGWTLTVKSEQVELRKNFGSGSLLLILSDGDGYHYKHWGLTSRGVNIHMSCNGPLRMSFSDWDEVTQVVSRVRQNIEASTST